MSTLGKRVLRAQSCAISVQRPILPHSPTASTDGSATRNPNKTGGYDCGSLARREALAALAADLNGTVVGLRFWVKQASGNCQPKRRAGLCRLAVSAPFLFSLTEAALTSILAASLTPPRGSQCATSCCWSFWLPCPPPTPGSDNHASGQSHLGGRNQRARSGSFDSWQSCHDPSRRESPHVCAATQS